MKYAIYNIERGWINRIADQEPQHPMEGVAFVECPDDTEAGTFYIDGQFLSREDGLAINMAKRKLERLRGLQIEEVKAEKIKELEAARYQAEIAGTTVYALGGVFVRTDKETQAELGKALSLLTMNPTFEIDWEFSDGSIVHLDGDAIKTVAQVVFTHVQHTRTDYKTKADAVAAATTVEELEGIGW